MTHIEENIIEITWVFNDLWNEGKIVKEWTSTGESVFPSFKEDCIKWAKEFEETRSPEVDCNYIDKITEFAKEKILKEYGIKKDYYITYSEVVEASSYQEAMRIAHKNAGLMFAIMSVEEVKDEIHKS